MGHTIRGFARTRNETIDKGRQTSPVLILEGTQLGDKSSGVDAVNALWGAHRDLPVIFITAFPERLLTGERPEPAILIAKPYSEKQVRAAVSQASLFATTERFGDTP